VYLWIELVDPLDRQLDFARVYSIANIHSLLYTLGVTRGSYVGFFCKFLSGSRIAFIDQVVHDDEINVSVHIRQRSVGLPLGTRLLNREHRQGGVCGISEVQVMFFSSF